MCPSCSAERDDRKGTHQRTMGRHRQGRQRETRVHITICGNGDQITAWRQQSRRIVCSNASNRGPQIALITHGQPRRIEECPRCAQDHVHRHVEGLSPCRCYQQASLCSVAGRDGSTGPMRTLLKALYGTRKGAKCWENDHPATMVTGPHMTRE